MPALHIGGAAGVRRDQPVWAITAYFNPDGNVKRLRAYREFRRRLGIPLVTAEASLERGFDLQTGDADVLLQVPGGSILWQKERLLNLALKAVPSHVEAVAWLDGDVVFSRQDWPQELLRKLQQCEMVQPFRRLRYLSRAERPEDPPGETESLDSAASRVEQGRFPEVAHRIHGLSLCLSFAPGMAWAARRDLLQPVGIYDGDVLCSADKLMLSAACDRWNEAAHSFDMSPAQHRHYASWARRFHDAVQGRVGCIEGDLLHLWHGDLAERRYVEKYARFREFDFDPAVDLALTPEGAWQWGSHKPALHSYVRRQLIPPSSTRPARHAAPQRHSTTTARRVGWH